MGATRSWVIALCAALCAVGCTRQGAHALRVTAVVPHHVLQADGREPSLRLVGSLHREAAEHRTIQVVLEASCSQVAAFYVAHTLDAECVVNGYPGETFHGRVSATRSVRMLREPAGEDIFGLITLDIDNPAAKVLPGRVVAASFKDGPGTLVLLGVAQG